MNLLLSQTTSNQSILTIIDKITIEIDILNSRPIDNLSLICMLHAESCRQKSYFM